MVEVVPPDERTCEHCGRRETWDASTGTWVLVEDAEPGSAHCLHEWDINGSYNPIAE